MAISLRTCASVLLLAALATGLAFGGEKNAQNVTVNILDGCDPTTFNAVLGTGACDGNHLGGFITFNQFLAELIDQKSVGEWRFNPFRIDTERAINFTLVNKGGETHTFTRVKKFGGGFVAPLNGPSGVPDPAPECAQMVNGQLVPQPQSENNVFVPAGQTMAGPTLAHDHSANYQCCIHPWMRLVVNADDDHEGHEGHDH